MNLGLMRGSFLLGLMALQMGNPLNLVNPKKEIFVEKKQFYQGIPVFGTRHVDHFIGDQKVGYFNDTIDITDLSVNHSVTKNDALLKADLKNAFADLVIYPFDDKVTLAWHIKEDAYFSRVNKFIDANSGKLINEYNEMAFSSEATLQGYGVLGDYREVVGIQNDKGLYELSSQNGKIQTFEFSASKKPGRSIASENTNIDHPEALDVHYYTEKVHQILKDKFNVDKLGDDKNNLVSTVNYLNSEDANFNGSFWNGKHMVYGRGGDERSLPISGALDIVAHEITHSIIEKTSKLVYSSESGALNESLCDIMGTYMEYRLTPDKFDWHLAEDTWTPNQAGDALRYMDFPTKDGKSSDHWDSRYRGYADNRGVHRNSGISNLAFYLFSEGGQHPRLSGPLVNGVGIEVAVEIFFKAYTQLLAPRSGFNKAREATLQIASQYGQGTVDALKNAWANVGIGKSADEDKSNPLPPPPVDDGSDNDKGQPGPPPPPPSEDDKNNPPMGGQEIVLNKNIPDNNSKGVTSEVTLSAQADNVKIYVLVEHPHQGDLEVRVKSPNGKIYTLHKRQGGRADNIDKTFDVKLKSGDSSQGLWKINVRDRSSFSTGKFIKWKIGS